jgi:serine protease
MHECISDRHTRCCAVSSAATPCPVQPPRPLPPNVPPPKTTTDLSGFVIVRLTPNLPPGSGANLRDVAQKLDLLDLVRVLDDLAPLTTRRLIISVLPQQLLAMEREAQFSDFRPLHSLTSYWRIDVRGTAIPGRTLVEKLRNIPGVDYAYEELDVTDPAVNPTDDIYSPAQGYLDPAPTGIDARWCWTQTGIEGTGAGIGVVDLERGWRIGHEDLAAANPRLIFNGNLAGVGHYTGDHGTAVLGEIVARDNNLGVIGIAPGVTSVSLTSTYDPTTATSLHVADALIAALAVTPAGDVLLLEVQRAVLPTETDPADLDAIRLAVARGVIVIEAAGNGGRPLDQWTDPTGARRLNRTAQGFSDSGAILVGAATSTSPHDRLGLSNFGSRLDCYAWGENVVTCGKGNLAGGPGHPNANYTHTFGGTSSKACTPAPPTHGCHLRRCVPCCRTKPPAPHRGRASRDGSA